jgi:hypothetical protein
MYSQVIKYKEPISTTLQFKNNKKEQLVHTLTISVLAFFTGLSIITKNPLLIELLVASSIVGLALVNRLQECKQKRKIFLKNNFSKIIKN